MDASFETAKYPGYTTKELRDVLTRTPDHPRADLINEEIERREAVAAGDMTKATPGERLRAVRKADGV